MLGSDGDVRSMTAMASTRSRDTNARCPLSSIATDLGPPKPPIQPARRGEPGKVRSTTRSVPDK